MSNFNDFHHLEPVYALAIEKQEYRRAAWLCIRALRTLKTRAEQELWSLRLTGCLKRR